MISREEAHRLLRYEAETGIFFWRVYRGRTAKAGSPAGSIGARGYVSIMLGGRRFPAHRIAWLLTHGMMPAGEIDHINGIRTDNRIINLRPATTEENRRNSRLRSNNTTGFKGVSRHYGKFRASIRHKGQGIHLGTFLTPEAAHAAYCKAATKYHGEFARFA